MNHPYDDIIHLNRPVSRHAKMTGENRAAQFAPFSALTGFDAVIAETGRLTQSKRELDEDEIARLNAQLVALMGAGKQQPEIEVTYFQSDARKDGGAYRTHCGRLKKIDPYQSCLHFIDGTVIGIEEISVIVCLDVDKEEGVLYNE